MTEQQPPARTKTDAFAWVMIALGTAAVALALWDVLVERDGSAGESIAMIAVGVLVIALGIQRRRRT